MDILINNAGAGSGPASVLDRSMQAWQSDLEINLLSTVRLDQELVPGMVERGRGVVVHVSSIASHLARPEQVSYAAAKAAFRSAAARGGRCRSTTARRPRITH